MSSRSPDGGPRDPFRVLALPYDADADDVRRAFRRRARETHPDQGGSAVAFHEVRTAYAALAADLDGERRRWERRPGPRRATGLDPDVYPTCPVRIGRTREGRRVVAYDLDARPRGWRPGAAPPPDGTCETWEAATEEAPAFGVWTVPLDDHRFRCVFGPPPLRDPAR